MIVVENLVKHYDGGLVKALNGVSFSVAQGEFCSLTGPSGCGKSTLLNLVGALDVPSSGTVTVSGQSLAGHSSLSRYRSEQVGFVFQLHNLIPNMTVLENIEIPMYVNRTITPLQRRERAHELLAEVEVAHRANALPTQISGGERQRAAVARALANSPKLLLADEPTGSVDSKTACFIMDAITVRCRDHGMTVLLVTHDDDVARRADRSIRMKDGLIL